MYNNILFDAKYYLFQLLGVLNYLNQVLLEKYRKMFVPFELTEFYIFRNTKNKIESQHAKLKKYLDSQHPNLEGYLTILYKWLNLNTY